MNHLFIQRTQKGFSLVEMAIVLLIVGLLLGGLLPTISGQIEQRRNNETNAELNQIKEALFGYAIINGRLPCPADPTIATGSTNAGVADCAHGETGVIPWVTLGIAEADAWGHRFTYAATSGFTSSNFTLSTPGSLTIQSAASGGTNIATSIPAIVVSHGTNGYGAYTQQGTQISTSSNADEADNSNGGTTFVSHDFSSTFDDLVVWVSPNVLMNRMVAAGKLP